MTLSRLHHVSNGTCTTRLIEAAGIPGTRSIWADPLHDGPVPDLPDADLLDLRRRHLSGYVEATVDADPANDLREWRAALSRVESYDELVLWFEHDLFDQLNLIQLLTWIPDHLPRQTRVSLICIGSFPGRPAFKGLGELTPADIASLLDTRARVTPAQHDLAAQAWRAFRASTPQLLDTLRRGKTSALPFLAAALHRFLQEYPWTSDGLSRSERRLLDLAAHVGGRHDLHALFPRMHDDEQAYYVTDTSLLALTRLLSSTTPPLLRHEGPLDRNAFSASVATTDEGNAVLARRADRVRLCGIDRWLGGVHLRRDSGDWRWEESRQRIVLG